MKRRLQLKVCGMREAGNIAEISHLKPDYLGFIFYPASPRCMSDEVVIPPTDATKRVGVFVNEDTSVILSLARRHALDTIQLHGEELPADCETIRAAGLEVIKVFPVDDETEFAGTKPYENVVDCFLFDTRGPQRGGNARTFNWAILDRYRGPVPFFLSGGLSPDNIGAVAHLKDRNICGVDVNSGVELRPGLKDAQQVKRVQEILNTIL